MATSVLIAHTGQRLQVDTAQFTSVDDLKASLASQSSIPANCIIALTPQGKALKLQSIPLEKDIYVYDIRWTQSTTPAGSLPSVDIPLPPKYTVSDPPNDIRDHRSLQSWQELFKVRRAWALKAAEDCAKMANATQDRYSEMDVMMRCLDAAVANLEAVVKGLEPRYTELKKWVGPAQTEYSSLVTRWERYMSLARSIPISSAMARFMTGLDTLGSRSRGSREASLEDLIELETARKAGKLAPTALRKFNTKVSDLDHAATELFQSCGSLLTEFERTVARSALSHDGEALQLLQDIEAVAKKIDTDYYTTLEYSDSNQNVLQASKIAANHTERLLPTMRTRALEMDEMLQYASRARNSLANESIDFMRSIAEITSLSTTVKSQILGINNDEDLNTFDYLRLIQQVPYMYASFAAEAIKRHEWLDKVKSDSSTLANEMALFQEEEMKRRRKWHKSVGDAYGPPMSTSENQVPGLEVNLLGDEEQWPSVTRQNLEEFFETLQRQKADSEVVDDIRKLIAELDSPTKQQSKRVKAFKNGSVHDVALGRSGLMIRGDDDVLRNLQDENSKLENKLKTAESRVRRLEDLLHRQSQASRPTLGNLFQQPSQQLSERVDSSESIRSPRLSDDRRLSSDSADPRHLQRVQQLESELASAKERSITLEKDIGVHTDENKALKSQMEEVTSTKNDLLQNMEALKREFDEERKSYEEEIKRLQAKLEDTEDAIDHFGESRENEKAHYDERVKVLEAELEALGKDHSDDILKAQGQVDFLRNESKLQRERIEALTNELQSAKDESSGLTKKVREVEEAAQGHIEALRDLHDRILPDSSTPYDLSDMIEAISNKATGLLSRLQSLENDTAVLKSDLDAAHSAVRDSKTEVATLKEHLSTEEMKSLRSQETLASEKARAATLEAELSEEREQLSQLRVKIADGETGSETLRSKLEEGERRVKSLTEELASKQSRVGSLEEEVHLYEERLSESQAKLATVNALFESRTEQARDLTQRLFSQNDRLVRLLERVGFSVTRDGTSMVIQKVPRAERSTQLSSDPNDPSSSSIRRSSEVLDNRNLADSADLELLRWMDAPEVRIAAEKYEAFITRLGNFDADAFSESMYRRIRDVEHVARKWQREARSYREKAHSLQKEAHDKIAFRHFKEGDLALFLPTRNQTNGAWAAFNIGFPHYFLREQEGHRLRNREWLVARISKIQEKVVDLSRSLQGRSGGGETESVNDEDNDNPFDLSDGLRWYMIDAVEDKPGAPTTPGMAKTTVQANTVEAMGDMHSHARSGSTGKVGLGLISARGHHHHAGGIDGVSKTLSKSLESRRSSSSSKRALPFAGAGAGARAGNAHAVETDSLRAVAADTPVATSPTAGPHHPPPPQSQQQQLVVAESPATPDAAKKTAVGGGPATPEERGGNTEVRSDNVIDSLLGP
ncbi:uncharacterized protein E0L32_003135 [Thyridium curvatum]|uniref:Autophagy-related protein 11 n=1 Tax=Thyridium curvatum TaxID=1093900 RepID=A0A507B5F7_9PEZI|nr:uncharacterized protein E0L32_003135 [Thyridium curvatum]TPX17492.1 hypothetical protein E0L32_003135 [Thyridium curvatum]